MYQGTGELKNFQSSKSSTHEPEKFQSSKSSTHEPEKFQSSKSSTHEPEKFQSSKSTKVQVRCQSFTVEIKFKCDDLDHQPTIKVKYKCDDLVNQVSITNSDHYLLLVDLYSIKAQSTLK